MKNFFSLNGIKNYFSYSERIQPVRDWFVLLALTALLFILGVAGEVTLYYQLQNQKVPPEQGVTQTQASDVESEIPRVQTLFQQRATEENNYQQVYRFVDPSLPGS